MTRLDAILHPAELAGLARRDLGGTVAVVIDVLRATTAIVTALAHGAAAVIPVATIAEAVALRRARPDVLLAGEREGLRITAAAADGVDFDLGNSPAEFAPARVAGRTIVTTTTNGTVALAAAGGAAETLAAGLVNRAATVRRLARARGPILLVCSGTGTAASFEDALAAGALADELAEALPAGAVGDAAAIAVSVWRRFRADPAAAAGHAANARRLLGQPALAADVPFCLALDRFDLVARRHADGALRRADD